MQELLDTAREAQANAYAPYSGFLVGAAIRADDGTIHSGCNIENAAYPEGICAEGAAIAAMVRAGKRRIAEVLVIGSGTAPCAPCGGCRQKIGEFADPGTPVHLCGSEGEYLTVTVGDLLPHAFGPADLKT